MALKYKEVKDVKIIDEEDYKHYDIVFTDLRDNEYTMEVKSIRNNLLNEKGKFADFFYNGIKTKLNFDFTSKVERDNILNSNNPMYIINASDLFGNIYNSKFYNLLNDKSYFAYVANDGILMFNPNQLKSALLGYCFFLNNSHTEDINYKYDPNFEYKAIINLNKGTFYPNGK